MPWFAAVESDSATGTNTGRLVGAFFGALLAIALLVFIVFKLANREGW
jgi:hypothetical protein